MRYYTTLSDPTKVTNLYQEWTGREQTGLQEFYTDIPCPSNIFLIVAYDEGKIVGSAQLILIDDWVWGMRWGLVENVYVKGDKRRQGIGRGLMKTVEDQAQTLGCKFLKLTSRKGEGVALYRALGYTEGFSFRKELTWSQLL